MVYGVEVAVCSEINTKYGMGGAYDSVKPVGASRNQQALKG